MPVRSSRDVRAARLCIWTAAAVLVAAIVMLLLPTNAYVDVPGQESDNFYSCGGVVYPVVEPQEEPGIAACKEENLDTLRNAGVVAGAGRVVLLAGTRFRGMALSRGERVFAVAR